MKDDTVNAPVLPDGWYIDDGLWKLPDGRLLEDGLYKDKDGNVIMYEGVFEKYGLTGEKWPDTVSII